MTTDRRSTPSTLDVLLDRANRIGRCGSHFTLPGDESADLLLVECGVDAEDRRETLAARPDPHRDRDLWWLLSGLVDELRVTLDRPVPSDGFRAWPPIPPDQGRVGRHLYLWALLTAVAPLRALHRRRGVPETVTTATMSLAQDLIDHRQLTGEAGIGGLDLWSPPLLFRGTQYRLGRHDFTRALGALGDGVAGHILMTHVPSGPRLDPLGSEASFAAARAFFPRHYPEEPVAAFTCHSWLLDPQLAGYLAEDTNIIQFQRRFLILPRLSTDDPAEGDREMAVVGLGVAVEPDNGPIADKTLDHLPRDRSLQRAFVEHLRAGRHWHTRTGVRTFMSRP